MCAQATEERRGIALTQPIQRHTATPPPRYNDTPSLCDVGHSSRMREWWSGGGAAAWLKIRCPASGP